MNPPDDGTDQPLSEVGCEGQTSEGRKSPLKDNATSLLSNMEILLSRLLAVQQPASVSTSAVQLIHFNPDDVDADVEGWCRVSELIIKNRQLEGIALLMALTTSLKGRAAACLTKLPIEHLSWELMKQTLLAKFAKPKLIQDYFDDIMRFQIATKETASESAIRLWDLIERIPKVEMSEEAVTGFVISVLCQKDPLIRREISCQVITNRVQLFRILGGVSLKRRFDGDAHEIEYKRIRLADGRFSGKCHFCGVPGHRQADCRRRRDEPGGAGRAEPSSRTPDAKLNVNCYVCGKPGHIATTCPDKKTGNGTTKEVNICERDTSRGTLVTSSGEKIPFLFDSGSNCSLIKLSTSLNFPGTECSSLVYLKGIGNGEIQCTSQISGAVRIGDYSTTLLFHVVPDDCISDPLLIGRDIIENGGRVTIDDNGLTITNNKEVDVCEKQVTFYDDMNIDTDLTGESKLELIRILNKYANNFINGIPTQRVTSGQMVINLIDPHKLIQRTPYRLAPAEKEVVREKIKELLDAGIIRESSSPYASPILLVKKKDNSDRMCVDYRELNSNTRAEHYPLPLIDEQVDQLSGAHYFSSLDMAAGFHQILLHPDSVEKTAFVTPDGQYEYLTMPFGLRNAPSVYQRCINNALKDLKQKPLVYMDDVLCHSSSVEEGLSQLDKVLEVLSQAGFSFKLQKCKFMKRKVHYLGYEIEAGEVRPNSLKIEALAVAPSPKTATQVRQFLGLASYFRKFIPNFTRIVGPLYPLTKYKGSIQWTALHENIRKTIIGILTSEPVLVIFDPKLPVELHCDASSDGYGAILIQRNNSMPHVVAYFSRRTTEIESRYHSYELETLAVVRAVEHFRHYLYGRKFTVLTDCNSLKASKSKCDLTPRVHRWWAILQAYDFDIIYREGRVMEHADYLSRNPISRESDHPKTNSSKKVNFVELHESWLSVEQKRDSEIIDLVSKCLNSELPEAVAGTYDVRDGILYRKVSRNKVTSWLPIVPRSLIWTLINHVHSEVQHLGSDKTLDKIYEQYWFPDMAKHVRRFVDSCIVCKASKGPSGAQPIQLHPIPKVSVPWHTLHIDFTGKLSGKSDQKEYCSVIIDGFTKYVLLEHTTSLNASSAVTALKKGVCLFGAPKRIIADQGRCYASSEFKGFCAEHNIDLHFIATGSSRANGQVERVMKTLKALLTIVENDPNKTWRDELGNIQLALNSTRSTVTKYTPTELMFGTKSLSLGLSKISADTHNEDRLDLEIVRNEASKNIEKAASSESLRFNQGRAAIKPFSKGEFVFIKSSERNQTKLSRKFKGPYVIISVLDNDRYELKSLDGNNRILKYAHENLRLVPGGCEGLIEISTSILGDDEAVTAENGEMEYADGVPMARPSTSGSVPAHDSDTVSIHGSDTMSVGSETLTAYSEDFSNSMTLDVEAEEVQE